ncbi:hypothetical protein EUGRSUZ_I02093 [Eucalyptus grandis]|uniref:Uncharacterized protein n=2 Tax=Eucalyptus grandis TaxID=71139 RepID=A0ACC3JHJ6_EUCGR|nr:hypothetical protein EUGRSUZ_I02093 [Eucalyptus grandis]
MEEIEIARCVRSSWLFDIMLNKKSLGIRMILIIIHHRAGSDRTSSLKKKKRNVFRWGKRNQKPNAKINGNGREFICLVTEKSYLDGR